MLKDETLVILLVEDESAHADAIQRALKDSTPAVRMQMAGTLAAYRQAVVVWKPDLVIMDLNLPDGCALDVLTLPPEAGPFPILIMTSYGSEQAAVEALKGGALDYVVKSPATFANMPATVAGVLREWKLLQERKMNEAVQKQRLNELENMLAKCKPMSGLLTICAGCKKIHDDRGIWNQLEIYIHKHSAARFTHSICPECAKEYYHEKEAGRGEGVQGSTFEVERKNHLSMNKKGRTANG